MLYHKTTREIIRQALHHAIDEREGLLDAYTSEHPHMESPHYKQRRASLEKEIKDFRLMLKLRYNEQH